VIPCPEHLRGVVHRYYLPKTTRLGSNGGDSWSLWLLDQNMGALCIVSDYGNWSHCWGRAGFSVPDFREQFLGLGGDYIANKLTYGVQQIFEPVATIKNVREQIVQGRRCGSFTATQARELFDAAGAIEGHVSFARFLELDGAEHFWESAQWDVANRLWLDHLTTISLARVKAAIRAELEQEARAVA